MSLLRTTASPAMGPAATANDGRSAGTGEESRMSVNPGAVGRAADPGSSAARTGGAQR